MISSKELSRVVVNKRNNINQIPLPSSETLDPALLKSKIKHVKRYTPKCVFKKTRFGGGMFPTE